MHGICVRLDISVLGKLLKYQRICVLHVDPKVEFNARFSLNSAYRICIVRVGQYHY